MGSRRERCRWCGVQLLVPPEAQTIQCSVCGAVSRAGWGSDSCSGGEAQEVVSQATKWLKGLIKKVSSNISFNNITNPHPGPMPPTTCRYHPQPPVPPPPLPRLRPVSAHGRKRALLCGVSYYGQRYRLKGSVNDVRCMRHFLVHKMGFPYDAIIILTEEETDPSRIPTKHNIRTGMQWLLLGCESGDSLVFHYSGHGLQLPDFNADEMDGHDETLCPVDHETQGVLVDDEINATIVRPLPHGATLHAIIDACHSGTVLDLPFVCRMNREGHYLWEDHGRLSSTYKGTSGGLALSFSSCDDHQSSLDTNALSGDGAATGVMTFSFIQAAQKEPGLTYGRLLYAMRSAIRETKTGLRLDGPIASFVRKVLNTQPSQVNR